MRAGVLAAMFVLVTSGAAVAQTLPNGKPWVYDPDAAKDIMRTCAACHGEFGEGGGGGVYPRLAGLNADYLAEQLRRFKSRERENIPMIPYATERELPEKDVLDVSKYLSETKLSNHPPSDDVKMDAFQRLQLAKQSVQIPREPGDIDKGGAIFQEECASCHGKQGQGRVKKPPLAGQYMRYLRAQIGHFLEGKRKHDDVEELMRPKTAEQWNDLWAYVSTLDD
ncbi:MAG: c-type cytochrome [Solirubrobacterales bacterium]